MDNDKKVVETPSDKVKVSDLKPASSFTTNTPQLFGKNTFLIFLLIFLLVAAFSSIITVIVVSLVSKDNSKSTTAVNTTTIVPTTTSDTTSTTITASTTAAATTIATTTVPVTTTPPATTFENSRIKLNVPAGWKNLPVSGKGVVLVKGNYTLNILTNNVGQASGVQGGRFAEIAGYMYAPELKIPQPGTECSNSTVPVTDINTQIVRMDLFYNPTGKDSSMNEQCGNPTKNTNLWYGSYFSTKVATTPASHDGHFLDYQKASLKKQPLMVVDNPDDEMVYTMSYFTTSINSLPSQDDSALQSMITEMTNIIKSIQYK